MKIFHTRTHMHIKQVRPASRPACIQRKIPINGTLLKFRSPMRAMTLVSSKNIFWKKKLFFLSSRWHVCACNTMYQLHDIQLNFSWNHITYVLFLVTIIERKKLYTIMIHTIIVCLMDTRDYISVWHEVNDRLNYYNGYQNNNNVAEKKKRWKINIFRFIWPPIDISTYTFSR